MPAAEHVNVRIVPAPLEGCDIRERLQDQGRISQVGAMERRRLPVAQSPEAHLAIRREDGGTWPEAHLANRREDGGT